MSNTALRAATGPSDALASMPAQPTSQPSFALTVATLGFREVQGFYRQPARVIAGLATPLIFWLALGSGFGSSIQTASGGGYMEFFFPGAVALVVLFASIFSNISIIEDRREGFLLSVLVAPVSRSAMALGKILGATSVGAVQGLFFLPLIPLLGLPMEAAGLPEAAALVLAMAFGLTALGFFFAWRLNSTQGFHSVMNMVLMPMWLLSGALFPIEGASTWMSWLMRLNPLFHGVTGLRRALSPSEAGGPTQLLCWTALGAFCAGAFALAVWEASRRSPENAS